jgi:selenocysteine lyase/cysteine desulfurase
VRQGLDTDHHINVSSRGGGIRVSLHCYNDSSDLQALAEALNTVTRSAR